jgi:hypothetical protein
MLVLLTVMAGCTRGSQAPTAPPVTAPNAARPGEAGGPALAVFKGVQAEVKPYTVTASLAEVTNYDAFKKAVPVTPEQEKLLARNLFACTPTGTEQLFHVYENNDYLNLPSFVTTDTVLQLYHVFYDFSLRTVETEALLPVLKRLTDGMVAESLKVLSEVDDPKLKAAALKNVAYFGVAARTLGFTPTMPVEALRMTGREMTLIDQHPGLAMGAIFPYKIDYSQFMPRGHYTRTETLKRFFRTMMWYGLVPFSPEYGDGGKRVRADEQIRQGLLLVRALARAGLEDEWETVYEPTRFYVGATDDLTPADWKAAGDQVFGKDARAAAFSDTARLDAFVAAVKKASTARIQAQHRFQSPIPAPDGQLRFMGQRYIPDSEILQRLSVPVLRPFPSGLDVMAVLGSSRAAQILDASPEVYNAGKWPDYGPERAKLSKQFAAAEPDRWTSNLYWGWLHALQTLLDPAPEGFPSVMRSDAWADKSLNTALASWSELRHDTILYGKQSAVECGDGEDKPVVLGYVEPNVPFYDRLLKLTRQSREGLEKRKLLPATMKEQFGQFEDLLTFLKAVSEKELRNEPLTAEEHEEIRYLGGKFEYLTLSVMSGSPSHWELVDQTDRNMAVVADVHSGGEKVLEEGVGTASELLAIVPIEGKLTLARGAVFSYYEFKQPTRDRLTDEKWQAVLKAGKAPEPPRWMGSFLAPARPNGLRRKEMEVYSSGC